MKQTTTIPRVLSIAGSDPSGGAGIQADLKSIAAMGGYGMAAITALTAQNTQGVVDVHVPPTEFLRKQLDAVAADVAIDAVKIGMLGTVEVIGAVRDWVERARPPIVVLDPVMVASSGDPLVRGDVMEALRAFAPAATLITPNLHELGLLLDEDRARNTGAAIEQGRRASRLFQVDVLVKGGHLDEADSTDVWIHAGQEIARASSPRVDTPNNHGTGCSLSSSLATLLAWGHGPRQALELAKRWMFGALSAADSLHVGGLEGTQGHGPIHHFHHQAPYGAPTERAEKEQA